MKVRLAEVASVGLVLALGDACGIAIAQAPAASSAAKFRGGTAQDHQEIQAFHDRAIERANSGNTNAALQDYLPRLRVLHTKRPKIEGIDDLKKNMQGASPADKKSVLVSEIEEAEVEGSEVGDWAYIVCRFAHFSVDRKTGAAVSPYSDGRYIALLEKTAQGWKVLLDIDNGADGAAADLIQKLKQQVPAARR